MMEASFGSTTAGEARTLLAGQNQMLEQIARRAPLSDVLDHLNQFIESQAPGALCSVLLVRDGRLCHGAARSLPDAFVRAVDGTAIGPGVGSCGNAAFTGQTTCCEDIATHPFWVDFRDLALGNDLRSCWSQPILSSKGDVLGTFAIYHRTAFCPDAGHDRLMEVASHIAGIAIELERADEALRRQSDDLRETDQRKDIFLAMLAHELRNPLAPLLTALESMARHANLEPEPVGRARKIAERQTRQLARLVDDLLDVSRFTRGHIALKTEPCAIDALLLRAIEMVQPQLDSRHHHLDVRLPAERLIVNADPSRMIQVMSNILSNAARYTEPGGTITVTARRNGPDVECMFTDTGIGMKPEFVGNAFDLFVQADRSLDRSRGGLGIGLTLVKQLVTEHGGKVTASSPGLGLGSSFLVTFPAVIQAADQPSRPPEYQAMPGDPCGLKVLLVDDNTDITDSLELALAGSGREVKVAHDGPSALKLVDEWDPDVVLLDIGLPAMDGHVVADRIRKRSGPRRPKLVALTGYGEAADRARTKQSGFDLHLVKPVDLDTLEAAIATH